MNTEDIPRHILTITHDRNMRGVIIDGQLCSGKTTVASQLEKELREQGRSVQRFSIDWFLSERDKRNYRNDPTMMNLESWFDLDQAKKMLKMLVYGHKGDACSFFAYDRSTGKHSLNITLPTLSKNTFLLIEGLYSLTLAKNITELPLLACYFSTQEQISFTRMLSRNTYIDPERLTYEANNIYFPSVREYEKYIRPQLSEYVEFVTDNFASVVVRETSQ